MGLASSLMVSAALAQPLPRDVRLRLLEAVVQVIPYDESIDDVVDWSGSGTVISPDGYILTNFHVVGDLDARQHYEWFAILTTDRAFTDQPPAFRYWARYVAGDPTLDLAVLRIEEDENQEPIPAGSTFSHALVGDSNKLIPGDPIAIVGYPGISGSTVTFTSGLMSGWLGEDLESGGKQWIKTDGKIAHGNSGGGAFDSKGNLIGVPTAGRTVQYDELDVEEQAYVRPIALAWSLIGPNVPTVARAGSDVSATAGGPDAGATGTSVAQTASSADGTASALADASASGSMVLAATCVNCTVGALRLGGDAFGSLSATEDLVNYHTYTVTVPEGSATFSVSVEADSDVDLVLKFGSQIESYADDGDWDYSDFESSSDPSIELENPRAGVWYIDVVNLVAGTKANYALSVR